MKHNIAVSFTDENKIADAQQLATKLSLPLITDFETATFDWILLYNQQGLGLYRPPEKLSSFFYIDFLAGKLFYRLQQASLKKELLARAIGISPREQPVIIDATAGLGRDSLILAALGFNMILLERSPIIHALLNDAMQRALINPVLAPIIKRMQLISADAIPWLLNQSADVVYLDPMFPERQKSASVKKEMVILQELLGNDMDSEKLLEMALTCARRRVVVKRPRLAGMVANKKPDFSLTGKSSRFDVYLTRVV